MPISKQTLAEQIEAYLKRRITLEQLVDWAENALMDADFDERDSEVLSAAIARLGLADVRAFGLSWDDCQDLLGQLGYATRVEVVSTSP